MKYRIMNNGFGVKKALFCLNLRSLAVSQALDTEFGIVNTGWGVRVGP